MSKKKPIHCCELCGRDTTSRHRICGWCIGYMREPEPENDEFADQLRELDEGAPNEDDYSDEALSPLAERAVQHPDPDVPPWTPTKDLPPCPPPIKDREPLPEWLEKAMVRKARKDRGNKP